MKRILFKLLMTVVLLLFFTFALKNMDGIVVRYFLGFEWHVPLVVVLFVFFGIGSAIGVLANFTVVVRQQREILGLKRELRSHMRVAAPATAESL